MIFLFYLYTIYVLLSRDVFMILYINKSRKHHVLININLLIIESLSLFSSKKKIR